MHPRLTPKPSLDTLCTHSARCWLTRPVHCTRPVAGIHAGTHPLCVCAGAQRPWPWAHAATACPAELLHWRAAGCAAKRGVCHQPVQVRPCGPSSTRGSEDGVAGWLAGCSCTVGITARCHAEYCSNKTFDRHCCCWPTAGFATSQGRLWSSGKRGVGVPTPSNV